MLKKHIPIRILIASLSLDTKINSHCNFGCSSFYNKTLHNGPFYFTKQMITIMPFLINKHNGFFLLILLFVLVA